MNAILFIVTVLIWGTTWFAITFQLGSVAIEWSLAYRFAIAALILVIFCSATGRTLKFPRSDHLIFLGLGIFLFSANYYYSYVATSHLTSGLVAVLFSTLTIMNIINSALFLKRPFEAKILGAAGIGLVGIVMIFWNEMVNFSWQDAAIIGVLAIILAAFIASLGSVIAGSSRAEPLPIIQKNTWGMIYGTAILTIVALFSGKPMTIDLGAPYLISLAYLSVFGTIIAFTCFLLLISRIGIERAGYFAVTFPVVALVISTLFEGYVWSLSSTAGIVLVLAGNTVVLRTKK